MARIFRFNQQAAVSITMQAAQQAGLPVSMPQISQGIQALLGKLGEFGIGLSVDDSSPYFQNLMANFGQNGAAHNVRQVQPGQPPQQQQQQAFVPPVQQQQPMVMPQPLYAPAYPQPGAPMQPMANAPALPQVQRIAPGAVVPGQPLPDLAPPPHLQGRLQPQGITALPGGPVPMQAPLMQPQGLGDNATGVTNLPPPPAPTILD